MEPTIFHFDVNLPQQAHFRTQFQVACPSHRLVSCSSREQADQILSSQTFESYAVAKNDSDPFPVELLYQIRTVYPTAHLIVISDNPLSAENVALEEKLHIAGFLGQPLTIQSLSDVWPAPQFENDGTFSGQIQVTLHELIQLQCNSYKDTAIEVRTASDIGWLYFERGQIIHSITSRSIGVEAAREIIGWKDGRFREVPGQKATHTTIQDRWENLLMEAAQLADERAL